MRRFRGLALTLAIFAAPDSASAFMVVPEEGQGGRYFVVVDRASGDHVPLAALPAPYSRFGGPAWVGEGLVFRWRYFRSPERGSATLSLDGKGRAAIGFTFSGDVLTDGDTVAAAVVLVGREGEAIATIYAAGRVSGGRFEGGGPEYRASAQLHLTDEAREAVAGFTVLTMKYYALQELDDGAVKAAMRRAVARVTKGAGSERWARLPD